MFRLSPIFRHGSFLTNYVKNSSRTLYTLNSLGIDGYIKTREHVQQYFSNDGDKFRDKMNSFLESDTTSMIFTEDLKNMVHLTKSNDKDIQLLEGMMRKFHKQSKDTRFGNFIFGPVVMRCLHHINQPDVALKWFKDPEFDGFFDQLISYQILCDLLYNQGRYQDVIDVYETVRTRQIQGGVNPRYVVTLVAAACYKQNTPESFKYLADLFMELINVGHVPARRAVTLAAALALKQNAPHVALEMVGVMPQQTYVTIRNIKVEAFAQLGRADDALAVLRAALQRNDSTVKHSFTRESLNVVKDAVNKTADNELIQNFNRLEKFLMDNGQVDNQTLEGILLSEIDTRRLDSRPNESALAASYNNNSNNRNKNNSSFKFRKAQYGGRPGRPGLSDMD